MNSSGTTNYLLSFVVPAYNAADKLNRALDSIICQMHESVELIIINDGSIDATAKICEQYRTTHVRVFHLETNVGLAVARDFGMRQAQGRYISVCDADDWLDSNHVDTLLRFIKTNPETDLFLIGYRNHTSDEVKLIEQKTNRDVKSAFILDEISCTVWNKIFRKNLIDRFDVNSGNFRRSEDVVFVAKYMAVTNSWMKIPDIYYNYDCTGSSVTRKPFSFDLINSHDVVNNVVRTELSEYFIGNEDIFFARDFRYCFMHPVKKIAVDLKNNVGKESDIFQFQKYANDKIDIKTVMRNKYLRLVEKLIFITFSISPNLTYLLLKLQK